MDHGGLVCTWAYRLRMMLSNVDLNGVLLIANSAATPARENLNTVYG